MRNLLISVGFMMGISLIGFAQSGGGGSTLSTTPAAGGGGTPSAISITNSYLVVTNLRRAPIVTTTTNYYMSQTRDFMLVCIPTNQVIRVFFNESAVGNAGQEYVIKRSTIGAMAVVVDPLNDETIDRMTNATLTVPGQSLTPISDGVNWQSK